jgi:hypothetical protein
VGWSEDGAMGHQVKDHRWPLEVGEGKDLDSLLQPWKEGNPSHTLILTQ